MSELPLDPFSAALADLLAPLTRAMIARGMTFAAAQEAMKRALLQAAIESEGDGVSDSRISVMTGLHRKDVKRLRADALPDHSRKTVNRAALVIGFWRTAPDFLDDAGGPRELPRETDADGPGFNDLVRLARLDVAPGTMLATFLDQGSVTETEDGRYRLRADALIPAANSEELIAAYRATLSTHMQAATQNLLAGAGDLRNFDRVVRYSHLSDPAIAELSRMARDGAQKLLQEINARARELQDRDAKPDPARSPAPSGRFAVGAYVLPTPGGTCTDEP